MAVISVTPSFIRTVTVGSGISPDHVHKWTRGLYHRSGIGWKPSAPCPEGYAHCITDEQNSSRNQDERRSSIWDDILRFLFDVMWIPYFFSFASFSNSLAAVSGPRCSIPAIPNWVNNSPTRTPLLKNAAKNFLASTSCSLTYWAGPNTLAK